MIRASQLTSTPFRRLRSKVQQAPNSLQNRLAGRSKQIIHRNVDPELGAPASLGQLQAFRHGGSPCHERDGNGCGSAPVAHSPWSWSEDGDLMVDPYQKHINDLKKGLYS
jgi:hypothetical protein